MYQLKATLFTALFISVYGGGEISILQSPESITFTGQEELELSSVKNIFSTALGFTVPEGQKWSGMVLKDPFHFADAVVVVAVPGVKSLDSVQGRTYPLVTGQPLRETYDGLFWKITARHPFNDNLTLNYLPLDDSLVAEERFGSLTPRDLPQTENLSPEEPVDKAFLDQINLLDSITAKIADKGVENDGVPDLLWFVFPSLHQLMDTYGQKSKVVDEAKRLLSSSVLLLSEVFNSAYDDKVMFAVICSDVLHTRRFRRDTAATLSNLTSNTTGGAVGGGQNKTSLHRNTSRVNGSSPGNKTVRATSDPDFPAMFNIFLWFGVSFFFVLLATTVGIAQMDPGRDSIIYRMTSNRMKKDN